MEIKPSKNFSLFIARRYFRTKKSHSAINTISYISMAGVAVGAMALIVVLSVFNGFDHLIKGLFNTFDPDIKITAVEGKVFVADSVKLQDLANLNGVAAYTFTLEENALFQYRDKQFIGVIKGVSDNYTTVTPLDKTIVQGTFTLKNGDINYGVVGQGVQYYLGYYLENGEPITVWVPRRTSDVSFNPEEAFNKKFLYTSGAFSIEKDFDSKYFIVPIELTRSLLEYSSEVTSIDIKLSPKANMEEVRSRISQLFGSEFYVKDRYQQEEMLFKIMKSEKWAIFFILTFILIVASFNIISSLMMVIIDKKRDMVILNHLGADWKSIRKIFRFEGWLVSGAGAVIGIVLGLVICWLQIQFGFVKLEGSGAFIIDSYPVLIKPLDIVLVFGTVLFIGFVTSWFPVRLISEKFFQLREE